jgi:uncharacterized membrane protein (UPF0127 family)
VRCATATGLATVLMLIGGCFSSGGNNSTGTTGGSTSAPARRSSDVLRKYSLDSLATATITIDGDPFRVWLAQEFDTTRPGMVEEGLMFVPTDEIADDQGMLFVFSDEQIRGFWMKNTIAPLDIAFARMDGTIVKIWQMPPLTLETFSSIEPAMFALEVKQGTFERLGIKEGDQMVIPAGVFKTGP